MEEGGGSSQREEIPDRVGKEEVEEGEIININVQQVHVRTRTHQHAHLAGAYES